jgi:aminomethyltransferase
VAAIIEPLVCGDIAGLRRGQLRYTLLLNAGGGVIDDLMVGRPPDSADQGSLQIIVNAGTKEGDFARIEAAAGGKATLTRADEGGLVAVQGPAAAGAVGALLPGVERLAFMQFAPFEFSGQTLWVSRSGYTGEDGYEILIPRDLAAAFWDRLIADAAVRPIGLGARDSLRLEAGMPLYGHDLDETISPVEAALTFALSRRRRKAADFPGAGRILREMAEGPSRVRVGLLVEGAPAREGAEVAAPDGAVVGRITSGGFSPSLGRPVAMAYVAPDYAAVGTRLKAIVRGRAQDAVVTPMPFVPHRYVRQA